ncbi:MAG TPA: diphthine--ammonia ligase [bacterium]
MREKVIFVWSGGKDSALALWKLMRSKKYHVEALLTTITSDYDRISMHGVRSTLLESQAESIGISLKKVLISKHISNEEYDLKMESALKKFKSKGIKKVCFGDIFLEDVRRYREENLSGIGMDCLFPIWKKDTKKLAHFFITSGFGAVITCVDTKVLNAEFAGREFDIKLLNDLPDGVDPCGENGEFHTFVYKGSIFKKRIELVKGGRILRDNRFVFCDLIPLESGKTERIT